MDHRSGNKWRDPIYQTNWNEKHRASLEFWINHWNFSKLLWACSAYQSILHKKWKYILLVKIFFPLDMKVLVDISPCGTEVRDKFQFFWWTMNKVYVCFPTRAIKTPWYGITFSINGPLWWIPLTHWGLNKMAAIFQITFSNAFSWMKMNKFQLRFD